VSALRFNCVVLCAKVNSALDFLGFVFERDGTCRRSYDCWQRFKAVCNNAEWMGVVPLLPRDEWTVKFCDPDPVL